MAEDRHEEDPSVDATAAIDADENGGSLRARVSRVSHISRGGSTNRTSTVKHLRDNLRRQTEAAPLGDNSGRREKFAADALFHAVDKDSSGTINLSEFRKLYAAIKDTGLEDHARIAKTKRVAMVLVLIVGMLLVFLAASIVANFVIVDTVVRTDTDDSSLRDKTTGYIVGTREEIVTLPLKAVPVLSEDELVSIKKVAVSYQLKPLAPMTTSVHSIVGVTRYSQTHAELLTQTGEIIAIAKGEALLLYPSDDPLRTKISHLCPSKMDCSAIKVKTAAEAEDLIRRADAALDALGLQGKLIGPDSEEPTSSVPPQSEYLPEAWNPLAGSPRQLSQSVYAVGSISGGACEDEGYMPVQTASDCWAAANELGFTITHPLQQDMLAAYDDQAPGCTVFVQDSFNQPKTGTLAFNDGSTAVQCDPNAHGHDCQCEPENNPCLCDTRAPPRPPKTPPPPAPPPAAPSAAVLYTLVNDGTCESAGAMTISTSVECAIGVQSLTFDRTDDFSEYLDMGAEEVDGCSLRCSDDSSEVCGTSYFQKTGCDPNADRWAGADGCVCTRLKPCVCKRAQPPPPSPPPVLFPPLTVPTWNAGCFDTADWDNGDGYGCADYGEAQASGVDAWCADGAPTQFGINAGYIHDVNNNPHENCCVCGGGTKPAVLNTFKYSYQYHGLGCLNHSVSRFELTWLELEGAPGKYKVGSCYGIQYGYSRLGWDDVHKNFTRDETYYADNKPWPNPYAQDREPHWSEPSTRGWEDLKNAQGDCELPPFTACKNTRLLTLNQAWSLPGATPSEGRSFFSCECLSYPRLVWDYDEQAWAEYCQEEADAEYDKSTCKWGCEYWDAAYNKIKTGKDASDEYFGDGSDAFNDGDIYQAFEDDRLRVRARRLGGGRRQRSELELAAKLAAAHEQVEHQLRELDVDAATRAAARPKPDVELSREQRRLKKKKKKKSKKKKRCKTSSCSSTTADSPPCKPYCRA